jgi:hypothetical protein
VTDPLDDVPTPRLDPVEENQIRRDVSEARRMHSKLFGGGLIGRAVEHSIEDPFTGEIIVKVELL